MENNININKKRIVIFLCVTFLITYLVEFGIMFPRVGTNGINTDSIAASMYYIIMFLPTIGVFITRIVTKEGLSDHMLKLTANKGRAKYYVYAWVLPFVMTILGAALYFVIFREEFDPNVSYFMNAVKGTDLDADAVRTTLISQSITSLILGPVMNCIFCFGEEWAWRGYLLVKLRKHFDVIPSIFISGVIWGLWHLPIIVMGHNYGFDYPFYPFSGILLMCLFCVVLGAFLSYVTIKSDSCIPAIIGHGAINGVASVGIYFTFDGGRPLLGPAPCGIIGMIPLFILSFFMIYSLKKDGYNK